LAWPLPLVSAWPAHAQSFETRLGTLSVVEAPDTTMAAKLRDNLDFQNRVRAFLNTIPLVPMQDYNWHRPHSALGDLTPMEFTEINEHGQTGRVRPSIYPEGLCAKWKKLGAQATGNGKGPADCLPGPHLRFFRCPLKTGVDWSFSDRFTQPSNTET
jgi:hypothetical protein